MKNLEEANSQIQKAKETIQIMEEVLSKARKLQEQKLILQAGSKYLPMEEIEMIIQKSDAKIEDAKLLHKLILELKKRSDYMTKNEIQALSEIIQTFQIRLQMGGSMPDGASGMICNENNLNSEEVHNDEIEGDDDDDDKKLDGDDKDELFESVEKELDNQEEVYDEEELNDNHEHDDIHEEVDPGGVDIASPELVPKQT